MTRLLEFKKDQKTIKHKENVLEKYLQLYTLALKNVKWNKF